LGLTFFASTFTRKPRKADEPLVSDGLTRSVCEILLTRQEITFSLKFQFR